MALDLGEIIRSPTIGGALQSAMTGLIILVLMAIAGVLIYFGIKRKKHNIPVIIFSERAGQRPKIINDRGGYFKRKNQWVFSLLKAHRKIPPPDSKYLHVGKKGSNILILHQKGLDAYVPVYFTHEGSDIKYKVADMDTQLWADSMQEILQKTFLKQNWFQKYGNYVIFGITAMMVILLIYLTLQKFEGLNTGFGSIARAFQHAGEICGSCVQNIPPAA